MCGIAGILGKKNNGNDNLLCAMLEAAKHRGPDVTDTWQNNGTALGHNRLSIIDLNASANQPMKSNRGRYVVVFNGEIYNYIELKKRLRPYYDFKTTSDTEVILAAYSRWGKSMLNKLNGMFAFAIWDNVENKLFAARDRFGVKPFYYAFSDGSFYFGSEIKSLWAAGIKKEKNAAVWARYLAYGSYGLPNETFWNGIEQLPGGHSAELYFNHDRDLKTQDLVLEKWYDFVGNVNSTPELEFEDLSEKYLALLKDSIDLRFRSDVPVGFNISGGLDSSTLLKLIHDKFPQNDDIESFTFYSNHSDYDELPWVEKMIKMTEKPLNKCLLNAEHLPAMMEKISYAQDEPFGGFPTIAYALIFRKARQKGIIVLLDGQGMDEAWAGYDYYQTKSGFTVQGTKQSPVKPEVLKPGFLEMAEKDKYPEPFDDQLRNLQYRDIFYTKIPRALRFNDRISMWHSTELREPFLDYRLVELAFAQNEKMKIQNGEGKWLLRHLMKQLIGDDLALAPKRALQTPQREWIANELKPFFEEKIEEFVTFDFVKRDAVLKLFHEYLQGKSDNSFYIWQWANLAVLNNNTVAKTG